MRRIPGGEHRFGVGGRVDHPHALAVVAAGRGLEDAREAEGLDVRDGVDGGPARLGQAELGEARAHGLLVLGVQQGLGAGLDFDAFGDEGTGGPLAGRRVVEGDHGAALGEAAEVLDAAIVPVRGRRGDYGGALGRVGGEHLEALAEGDGGLMGHAGELTGADHAHRRKLRRGVHRRSLTWGSTRFVGFAAARDLHRRRIIGCMFGGGRGEFVGRVPQRAAESDDGEERRRGDAPAFDLAERLRRDLGRGGDVVETPRTPEGPQGPAERAPARVLLGSQRRPNHIGIIVPV